MQRTRSNKY